MVPARKWPFAGAAEVGKSSVMLLLLRLLHPLPACAGNISVDDTPLCQIDRPTLRERILTIPQDIVFLPDGTSFQDNLDPFGASTEDDRRAVLDSVGLGGLVDEHGGNPAAGLNADMLSGGQRQLFSLARALLRHKVRVRQFEESHGEKGAAVQHRGILLLDEFSSGVDHDTDRAMQKIIREEFGSYTVVMVSHRLDMVMGFDTVVTMEAGRIVEKGRPSTLIETPGSKFRELWMVGRQSKDS